MQRKSLEIKSPEVKQTAPISKLPDTLVRKQRQFMDFNDSQNFVLSCQLFYRTQQTDLNVDVLLKRVAGGDQEGALKVLEHKPLLLQKRGCVTDPGKKLFENITALQYAFWALDKHMIEMLLGFISKEEAARQIADFEIPDSCYHFAALIGALENYVNQYEKSDPATRAKLWLDVGKIQKTLPAHIAQEYCNTKTSFSILPKFHTTPLPRKLEFQNEAKHARTSWFSNDGLGETFAIARGFLNAMSYTGGDAYEAAKQDLAAIKELVKVRAEQVTLLRNQLVQELRLEEKSIPKKMRRE